MAKVEHGFRLDNIRKALDAADWEVDEENSDTEIRRVYLGDVLSLSPSGKMYTPFACSNLTPCPTCEGEGRVTPRRLKRRTAKKQIARHASIMRHFDKLWGNEPAIYSRIPTTSTPMPTALKRYRPDNKHEAYTFMDRQPLKYRSRSFLPGAPCMSCNGMGTREAYLDELWNEEAERAISTIPSTEGNGVFMSWEDGDAFAVETRTIDEEKDGFDEDGDHDHPNDADRRL